MNSTGMHHEIREQLIQCVAFRILAGAALSLILVPQRSCRRSLNRRCCNFPKQLFCLESPANLTILPSMKRVTGLFAAATGNHSVEVIDLKSGKVAQSLTGLGKPHGLAWVAATGTLFVSDGARGELRAYSGTPFTLTGTIKLSDDADDMAYDEQTHLLFVGHGGSDAANPARVAVVDTRSISLVANLPVPTHPEGIAIDSTGRRVFANIADTERSRSDRRGHTNRSSRTGS